MEELLVDEATRLDGSGGQMSQGSPEGCHEQGDLAVGQNQWDPILG